MGPASLTHPHYVPEPKRKGKRQVAGRAREKRRAVINIDVANPRRTEQAAATPAKRTGGKELCPRVRHRRARRSWLCGIEKVQKRYLYLPLWLATWA